MSFSKAVDLLNLARMATGHVGVRLDDIEAEFGVVRRTAQRMTDALERAFPDVEDYTDNEGHKRWRIPRRKVAEFFAPSPEEVAALDFATESLDQQGLSAPSAQLKSLRSTLDILTSDKMRNRVEADGGALLEAMGHAARPGPRPVSNEAVDAAISEALKGPFAIEIKYKSRTEKTASWRMIEPYGLLLGARRYLIGLDCNKDDTHLRHYRVEDIEAARVSDDWFAIPDDFDLDQYASRAFGVFQDDREFGLVVWKFSPQAAPHAARFQFHPGQSNETLEDGSLLVRFYACGYLEMCWHLYAWGDQVEVIEPKALADMVRKHQRGDFPSLP